MGRSESIWWGHWVERVKIDGGTFSYDPQTCAPLGDSCRTKKGMDEYDEERYEWSEIINQKWMKEWWDDWQT